MFRVWSWFPYLFVFQFFSAIAAELSILLAATHLSPDVNLQLHQACFGSFALAVMPLLMRVDCKIRFPNSCVA